jgi:hypothetical protein
MNMKTRVEKSIVCECCTKEHVMKDTQPIQDISVLNAARDQKWGSINGHWFCPEDFTSIRATLKLCGLHVDSSGRVTPVVN